MTETVQNLIQDNRNLDSHTEADKLISWTRLKIVDQEVNSNW